jgi:transcriptional regulator with XRE-family HTH domain
MLPSGMAARDRPAHAHTTRFGSLLRHWRTLRRMSQLDVALGAEVSQRHLSFLESGRARPSRAMVLRISEALEVPLRHRNELLESVGLAAVYADLPLASTELDPAREALERILRHHEPYPAMVTDAAWNILMRNAASSRIIGACVDKEDLQRLSSSGYLNFIRLMFDASGLRPHVLSWDATATYLVGRLRREYTSDPDSPAAALLREVLPVAPPHFVPSVTTQPLPPTAPLELELDGRTLRLFNTLTTFGTPQEVSLQGLRVEMSFPMDAESDALLRRLASVSAARLSRSGTRREPDEQEKDLGGPPWVRRGTIAPRSDPYSAAQHDAVSDHDRTRA